MGRQVVSGKPEAALGRVKWDSNVDWTGGDGSESSEWHPSLVVTISQPITSWECLR